MGYTHYWRQNKSIPSDRWQKIADDAFKLISAAPCKLAYEEDDPEPPYVGSYVIRFNGTPDPDGHETFILERVPSDSFSFCKTASKPYDTVVCAVLAIAKEHCSDAIKVTSDGDERDWKEPLAWASQVLGREVKYPFLVNPRNTAS
jgi:hypothetical protein